MSQPILVGVTGGIGSGKSLICKILEVLGYKTYYADKRGKWLTNNHPEVTRLISNLFGEEIYVNGQLDRKTVAGRVFQDRDLLEKLNAIIHPAVAMDFIQWTKDNSSEKILFKESALLFETNDFKSVDYAVLVTASEEVRIERVLKRDTHRTKDAIKNIMKNQLSDEEKMPLADFVIDNGGQISVIHQVINMVGKINS